MIVMWFQRVSQVKSMKEYTCCSEHFLMTISGNPNQLRDFACPTLIMKLHPFRRILSSSWALMPSSRDGLLVFILSGDIHWLFIPLSIGAVFIAGWDCYVLITWGRWGWMPQQNNLLQIRSMGYYRFSIEYLISSIFKQHRRVNH